MELQLKYDNNLWCIWENNDVLVEYAKNFNLITTGQKIGQDWARYLKENEKQEILSVRKKFQLFDGWYYPSSSIEEFISWFKKYVTIPKTTPNDDKVTLKRGICVLPMANEVNSQNMFSGKRILLSGFSKEDEFKRMPIIFELCNITNGKNVNKKLDYLICGIYNDIGGKYSQEGKQLKANELGIPIVSLDIFLDEITKK